MSYTLFSLSPKSPGLAALVAAVHAEGGRVSESPAESDAILVHVTPGTPRALLESLAAMKDRLLIVALDGVDAVDEIRIIPVWMRDALNVSIALGEDDPAALGHVAKLVARYKVPEK